jgi:FkbM family methyltransferase
MTKPLFIEGIGEFLIPSTPEARAIDSEKTVRGVCGRYDPELARQEKAWGHRVGQEYSYLGRAAPEAVRTIVDIGCNVGSYFVWACRVWWPDSVQSVYAFDPGQSVIDCAHENRSLVQRCTCVQINRMAVTVDPAPMFRECVRTGCSHTAPGGIRLEDEGYEPVEVPAIHPRELPPCDALKCDAEGVEGEIIEHYPHWGGVKVLQLEWHTHEHRQAAFALAAREGLRLMKNDCGESEQGVGCWVRP